LVQRQIVDVAKPAPWNLDKGPAMNHQENNDFEPIDHKTSRSICDAVGERLQQSMRPEQTLPPQLLSLIEQLRRSDRGLH